MLKKILTISLLILSLAQAKAQFVNNGRGSASVRWQELKAPSYSLLYPVDYTQAAMRMAGFMDSVSSHITHNLQTDLMRAPMVVYNRDQFSNGMVTWAPKRAELAITAPINSTSTPWMQQLVVHEWRHVAQISALRNGLTNVARVLFGQGGMGVGLIVNSTWMLEGDAVNAETQLTEYGRGLQPDFTIGYRGMASGGDLSELSTDFLACGSFKEFVPDVYKYGYQIVTAAETYVSPTIMGEVFHYNSKVPILISPDYFYLRKHYNTSWTKIRKRLFTELDSLWAPLERVDENFEIITSPAKTYTTYSWPVPYRGGMVAVKKDFRHTDHLVFVDSLGEERKLKHTGSVSSRVAVQGDKIYFTEYKPDLFYQLQNYSIIVEYDLLTNKTRRFRTAESNYLVTPIAGAEFATIKNNSQGEAYIQVYDNNFEPTYQGEFEHPTTLHGLAWDKKTGMLCFIAVDHRGMWIGAMGSQKKHIELKAPSAVTLSELRAEDGCLVFGSIASGKDEVHILDIETRTEYQLTQSRFGSAQPSLNGSTLLHRTYTPEGWMLSKQKIDTLGADKVQWSRLPKNIVNPKRHKWNVVNTDTITIAQIDTTTHSTKRYRRAPHMINFHTWAPIAVDFEKLYNELSLNYGVGATGFFQSTLGDMYGSMTAGSRNGDFWAMTDFTYASLPVEMDVRVESGGGDQVISAQSSEAYNQALSQGGLDSYFTAGVDLRLPMNFSWDGNLRLLQPSFSLNHYNTKFYNQSGNLIKNGYQSWDASLWWSSHRRTAYQDIVPTMGYSLSAGVRGAFGRDFSKQYHLWGRAYLPGFVKPHALTLRTGMQWQEVGTYNFSGKIIGARGVDDPYVAKNYYAASLDYTFPFWYPDGGIGSVLNFKRLFFNVFGDYNFGDYMLSNGATTFRDNHSYGVELGIDFNVFRSRDLQTRLMFALPNSESLHFGVSFEFDF